MPRSVCIRGHFRDPWSLSGGEAQRVALARALVRESELLLLDEPFASLDALTRLKRQALVRALFERHRPAILLVTQDVDEAILLADRILFARRSDCVRTPFQCGPFAIVVAIERTGRVDHAELREQLFAKLDERSRSCPKTS